MAPDSSNSINDVSDTHEKTVSRRPRLRPEDLDKITKAENDPDLKVRAAVRPLSPANPDFVYDPVEINAICWKVIGHIMTYAEEMFDAQAQVYYEHHPNEVAAGDLLTTHIGPEVRRGIMRHWTKREFAVEMSLQARWTPE